MSNATLAVYGRLGSDPREHETRKGGAMATASLAATLDCRVQGEPEPEDGTLWLNVVAFGRVAEDLCRCSKGDPVSVSGPAATVALRHPRRRGTGVPGLHR